MKNQNGFDFQKLDSEVDALLSDVKNLLDETQTPEQTVPEPEPPEQEAASAEKTAEPEAEGAAFPPEAMSDATVVYKPLTYYEQSKPAYQTARRAQYEREREQARQERERQQQEREAEEARKMQELEQRQKKPRRTPAQPPEDEQEYAQWLYEQGSGEETVAQRETVARRERKNAPEKKPKKRHPVRAAIVIVLALLLIGTAMLWVMARQPETQSAPGTRRKGCSTILLAGTDKDGFRTDTMMLLTADRARGTISLVSIPRDTLVFCEYSVPKINSAYGWAGGGEDGMQELMQRVSEIIGFMPDGYVLISLEGFEKLIDRMGGVEFNVPMDMHYSDPSQGLEIDLSAGEQKLNGSQAMQLVRFRSGYAMADLDRVSVQRAFVKAALSQWASPEKLVKLPGALSVLKKYTQSSLSTENYLWLAETALFCDLENVRMETLPGSAMYIGGGSYYVLDPSGVAETVNACCNPYEQGVAVSDLSIRVG